MEIFLVFALSEFLRFWGSLSRYIYCFLKIFLHFENRFAKSHWYPSLLLIFNRWTLFIWYTNIAGMYFVSFRCFVYDLFSWFSRKNFVSDFINVKISFSFRILKIDEIHPCYIGNLLHSVSQSELITPLNNFSFGKVLPIIPNSQFPTTNFLLLVLFFSGGYFCVCVFLLFFVEMY